MDTLFVIGLVVGLWMVVMLVVLGACWAARRGDEALEDEARLDEVAAE